jgi:hypothetical protein
MIELEKKPIVMAKTRNDYMAIRHIISMVLILVPGQADHVK